MKFHKVILLFSIFSFLSVSLFAKKSNTPIMGWSSWNHFRVNIDEKMIREQADAMISSGMYAAGYRYVNIDDGYFGGRDASGKLYCDSVKFSSGMKVLATYIHKKGLKAGIYSDAGQNTCGSIWDNDKKGIGVGLDGHVKEDCNLFFNKWGFDFLKVDWCGGQALKLDTEKTYLSIIKDVRDTKKNIVFNVCCWKFPGEWAIKESDSWRISGDIEANFKSICHIIDLNADLAKYASPGHFNDMDMLQVGRGMTYDEDKSHFSMWCMMASPLLAGNDLRKMSKQTIEILTNKELIAINQDKACVQAERISTTNQVELWVKPLYSKRGKSKAIAVFNRSAVAVDYLLSSSNLQVGSNAILRDVWLHTDLGKMGESKTFRVPAHGIVVLKITE